MKLIIKYMERVPLKYWNIIFCNSTNIHCFETESNGNILWFNANQLKIVHILCRKLAKVHFYVWLCYLLQVFFFIFLFGV